MAKIGKQPRLKTQQQQLEDAELMLIIEDFSRGMQLANRNFIVQRPHCSHQDPHHFTPYMDEAWARYIDFCRRHPQ